MAKILLVEDDEAVAASVQEFLAHGEHSLTLLIDGADALKHLETESYDLLILDWGLPSLTGLKIAQDLRSRGVHTPILMLTGRSGIDDKETGFESGIDDYLTKPFSTRELGARIRALVRRPEKMIEAVVSIGTLTLDTRSRRVTKAGTEVYLRPQEFNLLEFLMRHPGEVFTPEALLDRVWHSDSEATRETVRTHVNRIRTKVESKGEPPLFHSIFGVGYKLELQE